MSTAIRKVIKENLEAWMRERSDLSTQERLADASGTTQSTVGRILRCEVAVSVDVIEDIATAFHRDPGDLLRTNDAQSITYDRLMYAKLPSYEKARIAAFIQHVLAQHASGSLSYEELKPVPETQSMKTAAARSPRRGLTTINEGKVDESRKGPSKRRSNK